MSLTPSTLTNQDVPQSLWPVMRAMAGVPSAGPLAAREYGHVP